MFLGGRFQSGSGLDRVKRRTEKIKRGRKHFLPCMYCTLIQIGQSHCHLRTLLNTDSCSSAGGRGHHRIHHVFFRPDLPRQLLSDVYGDLSPRQQFHGLHQRDMEQPPQGQLRQWRIRRRRTEEQQQQQGRRRRGWQRRKEQELRRFIRKE